MTGSFKDLKIYQIAYELAMEVFNISKTFPKEETNALIDQIRRSSCAICANIAEAYRKRRNSKQFTSKITDADAETSETIVWLDSARDSGYLSPADHDRLESGYREVGRMLGGMADSPERFLSRASQVSEESHTNEVEE